MYRCSAGSPARGTELGDVKKGVSRPGPRHTVSVETLDERGPAAKEKHGLSPLTHIHTLTRRSVLSGSDVPDYTARALTHFSLGPSVSTGFRGQLSKEKGVMMMTKRPFVIDSLELICQKFH
ncbi:hypothetical protein BaRGS_00009167 [Batillaria attramentaria]|uniref:Uncharacterized protein n=1 Tax=Batillaria attramentaria TaxID=370345 RepID=A0ABD0LJD9_9CAEN